MTKANVFKNGWFLNSLILQTQDNINMGLQHGFSCQDKILICSKAPNFMHFLRKHTW